jgi:NADH:ubiquinone oxidoreductase subunit K
MKKKKKQQQAYTPQREFIFQRKNYIFMFIGIACMMLGFLLMGGGGSDDPSVFNPDIYNFRRIRLAPTLVLIGLAIEVYAILLNPHKKKDS